MQPHVRVLLFCAALVGAPALYALGEALGGDLPAALLPAGVVAITLAYAAAGGSEPPAGATPR